MLLLGSRNATDAGGDEYNGGQRGGPGKSRENFHFRTAGRGGAQDKWLVKAYKAGIAGGTKVSPHARLPVLPLDGVLQGGNFDSKITLLGERP